jgi:hypothetical protein
VSICSAITHDFVSTLNRTMSSSLASLDPSSHWRPRLLCCPTRVSKVPFINSHHPKCYVDLLAPFRFWHPCVMSQSHLSTTHLFSLSSAMMWCQFFTQLRFSSILCAKVFGLSLGYHTMMIGSKVLSNVCRVQRERKAMKLGRVGKALGAF